jgi:hypothetical protein
MVAGSVIDLRTTAPADTFVYEGKNTFGTHNAPAPKKQSEPILQCPMILAYGENVVNSPTVQLWAIQQFKFNVTN